MKYKIKFEIDLSGMDKQEIRDYKIELIQGGIESVEVEIDPNIQLPKLGDIVMLSNKEFKIIDIKYSIKTDEYVILFFVKSVELIKRERDNDLRNSLMTAYKNTKNGNII